MLFALDLAMPKTPSPLYLLTEATLHSTPPTALRTKPCGFQGEAFAAGVHVGLRRAQHGGKASRFGASCEATTSRGEKDAMAEPDKTDLKRHWQVHTRTRCREGNAITLQENAYGTLYTFVLSQSEPRPPPQRRAQDNSALYSIYNNRTI